MSGITGMNIKMAIYGESHGRSIGVVLDGLPPGLQIDEEEIAREMARRAPGQNALSTARKEQDAVSIESGFFNGFTTGTPLCARIVNSDQHSKDYSILADKMRPGHADYAGHVRYQGFTPMDLPCDSPYIAIFIFMPKIPLMPAPQFFRLRSCNPPRSQDRICLHCLRRLM